MYELNEPYHNGRSHDEVMESAVEGIIGQQMHTMIAVIAADKEDSEAAYVEIVERMQQEFGPKRKHNLGFFKVEYPEGSKRFDFGRRYDDVLFKAPEEPKQIIIGNADAFARGGRSGKDWIVHTAGVLRSLCEETQVRPVFVGTESLMDIVFADGKMVRRTSHFDLDPERNEEREDITRRILAEKGW